MDTYLNFKIMTKAKNYIPKDFHTVTPFLVVDGGLDLIDFLVTGLGGKQLFVMKDDNGVLTHGTVQVGDSMIMIGDTMKEMPSQTAMLYLYVKDADAAYNQALGANAENVREPKDEFYGDRAAAVKDRWGNTWWFATQKEDVEDAELERRAQEAYKKQNGEQPVY